MAGDHDIEAGRGRIQLQLFDVMEDVNAYTFQIDSKAGRYSGRPRTLVVVSSDRIDRRNRPKLFDDLRAADVTRMNDMRHAAQSAERLGPQQPVRVGNEADSQQLFHDGPRARDSVGWRECPASKPSISLDSNKWMRRGAAIGANNGMFPLLRTNEVSPVQFEAK